MRIIVLDVETTGLYNKKENNLDNQPYIIQFAGIYGHMTDDGFKQEGVIDLLFKPPISIPKEASDVHHIYNVDVMNKQPIDEDLIKIAKLTNECDVVIGHNIEFDINCIRIEIERLKKKGIMVDFSPKKVFCTMTEAIDYCRLPKKSGTGFKRPRLQELCKKALGEYFHGAHNALVDVEWTLKAFIKLYTEGVFKLEERKQQGLFD